MSDDSFVVTGGPVWTGSRHVEAVGVSHGRVVAVGDRTDVSGVMSDAAVLDVEGRRVIPGLIDSHAHVVRAGLTWNQVVRWDDLSSLEVGLGRIRAAAERQPRGSWIRVLGGWHPGRFVEGRGPTRTELDDAGGGHPTYVQLLYEEGILNTAGLERLLSGGEAPGVERDADSRPTGRVTGPLAFARISSLFDVPSPSDRLASTRALMADFASHGVTGAIDPGGIGLGPDSYSTVFDLWKSGDLDMRLRLFLGPGSRGHEMADIQNWVTYVQPGFGDDLLRYVGMGEILQFECHDMEGVRPFTVTAGAAGELFEICDLLASRNWPVHLHAILDSTVSSVLDVWEKVDHRHGLRGRRFSLAHAEPISYRNLERVRDLGVGVAIQNRLMYRTADSASMWGSDVAANAPPLDDILAMGIPLGAGTDATVVSPHDPWLALWWLVTGRSFDGAPPRAERHRLSIEQALAAYTRGSAWFSFDEQVRGHLEPGAFADLAVLDSDPFSVDPDQLPEIRSDLTLVGGRPTHQGPAFL